MTGLRRGTPAVSFGGVRRTIDVVPRWMMQLTTDKSLAFQAYWTDGVGLRTGLTYSGMFPTGANSANGIQNDATRGRVHLYYDSFGSSVKDFYSLLTPRVRLVRPTQNIVTPYDVWEVEADIWCDQPASAPTDDLGIAFHGNTSVTSWANGLTVGQAVGDPGSCGFGIFWTGANGDIKWQARNALAAAPLTGSLLLRAGPNWNKWVRVRVRIEAATLTRDAQVTVYLDDVAVASQAWVTGSAYLPDLTLNNYLGGLRPFVRCHSTQVSANLLRLGAFRVSAAASVADMEGT